MTQPNFRALCAELVNELHGYKALHPEHGTDLIDSACRQLVTPPPEAPTVPWADVQVATEKAFQFWWDNEGSGMPPKHDEEISAYAERISKLAWSNGAYVACARWGR